MDGLCCAIDGVKRMLWRREFRQIMTRTMDDHWSTFCDRRSDTVIDFKCDSLASVD